MFEPAAEEIRKNGLTQLIQLGPDGHVRDSDRRLCAALVAGLHEAPVALLGGSGDEITSAV